MEFLQTHPSVQKHSPVASGLHLHPVDELWAMFGEQVFKRSRRQLTEDATRLRTLFRGEVILMKTSNHASDRVPCELRLLTGEIVKPRTAL